MKRLLLIALVLPGCGGAPETLEGRTARLHRQYSFPKSDSEKRDALSEIEALVADCRRELWRSDPSPSFVETEARRYIEAGWLCAIMLKDEDRRVRAEAYAVAADAFRIGAPLVFQDFDAALRHLLDIAGTGQPEDISRRSRALMKELDAVAGRADRMQAMTGRSSTFAGTRGEPRVLAAVAAELVRRFAVPAADDLPDRLHQSLPDAAMRDKAVYVWLDLAYLHEKLGHREKAAAYYSQVAGADAAKDFQRRDARAGLERLKP